MRVGVPKESAPGERRVALVPESVERLVSAGSKVALEPGAGAAAGFSDDAYREAGATVADSAVGEAELVARVRKPSAEEAAGLAEGTVLVGFLEPLTDRGRHRAARRARRRRVRDGVDPAHHARAVDGRAVVAGDGRPATRPCCSPPSGCRGSSRC